jgi:predicted HAD superfamily hydrolase
VWLDLLPENRYEKLIKNCRELPLELSSVLSGASRAVRLSTDEKQESAFTTTAAGVLAPLLFLFAWWVLKDAESRGIKRLYFLARDGQILHRVAKVLAARWQLDIELRYLYCSRESLLAPSFKEFTPFESYWISWGYLSTVTLGEICQRLALEPLDFHHYVDPEHQELLHNPDMPLVGDSLARLMACFESSGMRDLVQTRNKHLFDHTVGYLLQERLGDGSPYALVDTGWKGTSQYAISLILEKAGIKPASGLSGYYLGLNQGVFIHRDNYLYPFLFDWSRSARNYLLYNFLCFELLCSGDHGRVQRYIQQNDAFVPVLGDVLACNMEMITQHHRLVEKYAEYAVDMIDFDNFPRQAASFCSRLMQKFISDPLEAEATAYGERLVASEILEGDIQCMAPGISFTGFVRIAAGKQRIAGYWPQASFIRSGLKIINFGYNAFLRMKLLEFYRRYFLKY